LQASNECRYLLIAATSDGNAAMVLIFLYRPRCKLSMALVMEVIRP
jgi:hypothetical protein